MGSDDLIIQQDGGIGHISLNRPEALHALNFNICEKMTDILLQWRDDPKISAIIVDHAEGTRGFCAGGDIRMLAESGAGDGKEAYRFFATEYRLNTLIHSFPKPYISFMDGVTMGGGVGISIHGHFRIATEHTLFAMPEAGIGLFPDVGGGWFLPRLKGKLGTWLALTGARLKGQDVKHAGIATHYISSEQLAEVKAQLGSVGSGQNIDTYRKILDDFDHLPIPVSWPDFDDIMNVCFNADSIEAIMANLERYPNHDWARKQLQAIGTKSPQTLKVTLQQIYEGAKMTCFADVMRMEYRIARRIVGSHDFLEGVRAIIIDKDHKPKWSPDKLEGITQAHIDQIFASLGPDELELIDGNNFSG